MEIKNMNQRILHQRSNGLLPFFLSLAVVLTGCTVGPNYKKPAVNVPAVYRQPTEDPGAPKPAANVPQSERRGAAQNAAASLGDEKWWEVFEDKELQGLIRTALNN